MRHFAALAMVAVLASTVPIKWGHKKPKTPLVHPDAPFSIDLSDPRDEVVRQYLEEKRKSLRADLKEYPEYKDQVLGLIDEINALEAVPVADADFAEHFAEFHASPVSLWDMEKADLI